MQDFYGHHPLSDEANELSRLHWMNQYMKILKDVEIAPLVVRPGSTIEVAWNDEMVMTEKVQTDMIADRCIIFEVNDQFGFKKGIGAILGEKNS